MKSLILFDGSRSASLILQTACEDAYRRAARLEMPEANEVLVIAFENLAVTEDRGEREEILAALLETAIQRLECCGDFLKIRGEIICCRENEATSVLIERAREWQADAVYLPMLTGAAQPIPASRSWFGFGRKSLVLEVETPSSTLSSDCFNVSFLLQEAGCRLVLNNPDGTVTRLHYYAPVNKRVAIKQVSAAPRSVWPEAVVAR